LTKSKHIFGLRLGLAVRRYVLGDLAATFHETTATFRRHRLANVQPSSKTRRPWKRTESYLKSVGVSVSEAARRERRPATVALCQLSLSSQPLPCIPPIPGRIQFRYQQQPVQTPLTPPRSCARKTPYMGMMASSGVARYLVWDGIKYWLT